MSCEVSSNCLNNSSCFECAFDGDKYSEFGKDLYNAINKKIKHPIKAARKQEYKDSKKQTSKEEKIAKNSAKNKDKQKLLKAANKAEVKVSKTLNSGRINQDSDIKAHDLVIDVKMQSTRKNPVIFADEFIKAQGDALRADKEYGVLALINSENITYYVVSEELFIKKFI